MSLMELDLFDKIYLTIVVTLTGLILILALLSVINIQTGDHVVNPNGKCYDEFGSEIHGLTCKQEKVCGFIDRLYNEEYCNWEKLK